MEITAMSPSLLSYASYRILCILLDLDFYLTAAALTLLTVALPSDLDPFDCSLSL